MTELQKRDLTFEQGTQMPDCDGAQTCKLSVGNLNEEKRHTTHYEEKQVRNEEDG